jgi:putative membrane protein insertion efficiency factor
MNLAQHILISGLWLYRRVISPAKLLVFGPLSRCRFSPSCSEYALEAVGVHGALAGSWLAAKRVCRCHPWGGCGEDPVPGGKAEDRERAGESLLGELWQNRTDEFLSDQSSPNGRGGNEAGRWGKPVPAGH